MDPSWLQRIPVCASTNDRLRDELEDFQHGDCLWTDNQTAGRGQHGRRWLSPKGVLTASFLLRLPGLHAGLVSLVAGLAVAQAVEALVPEARIQLKWPNDCYLRDRKVAGLLCEGRQRGADRWCITGIGLNLNPHWRHDNEEREALAELTAPPIGLNEVTDAVPDPDSMLLQLRAQLLACWEALSGGDTDGVLTAIRERDWLQGRRVEIIEPDGGTGVVERISSKGALRLRRNDGEQVAIVNGRVRVLDTESA